MNHDHEHSFYCNFCTAERQEHLFFPRLIVASAFIFAACVWGRLNSIVSVITRDLFLLSFPAMGHTRAAAYFL